MIFVTVGTQLPFDRMIRTVDLWAARAGRADVFAQIGPSKFRPSHIAYADFIPADDCRRKTEEASVIIAHAGMGSIITALELAKPIIVMPRRCELGEHRNNHQVSTAQKFAERGSIHVAMDEHELLAQLEQIDRIQSKGKCDKHASPQLLSALADFIERGKRPGQINIAASANDLPIDFRPATNRG